MDVSSMKRQPLCLYGGAYLSYPLTDIPDQFKRPWSSVRAYIYAAVQRAENLLLTNTQAHGNIYKVRVSGKIKLLLWLSR